MLKPEYPIPTTEGSSSFHIYETGDRYIFCKNFEGIFDKNLKGQINKGIARVDEMFDRYFRKKIIIPRHKQFTSDITKLINKEISTWGLWKEAGINVLELIGYTNKEIRYKFLPNSISYSRLLNKEDSIEKFETFLEIYDKIRSIAKKERNPNLLHSDPHLKNFLYIKDKNEGIPIDSGILLNPRMSFESLDTHLLATTLKSISSLDTNINTIKGYVRRFKDMLTEEEVENIVSLDYKIPILTSIYLHFREEAGYRVMRREKIDPLEQEKMFFMRYNTHLKDILTE